MKQEYKNTPHLNVGNPIFTPLTIQVSNILIILFHPQQPNNNNSIELFVVSIASPSWSWVSLALEVESVDVHNWALVNHSLKSSSWRLTCAVWNNSLQSSS